MHDFPARPDRRGLTLIELLVTIAIVVLLAALVFPLVNSIRDAAAKVKCVSNFRNIYMATLAFSEDHDGKLPPARGPATEADARFTYNAFWWVYLAPYTVGPLDRPLDSTGMISQQEAAIYNCPVRLTLPITPYPNGTATVSYAMAVNGNYRLRTMDNKSKTLFLTEASSSTLYKSVCKSSDIAVTDASRRLKRFHNGALNVLFYDGHVELFSGTDEELASMLPSP